MCLFRGKVVDIDGDLICYKIYHEKRDLFGRKYYSSLYHEYSDKVRYKVGKAYDARLLNKKGCENIENVNDQDIECSWYQKKRKGISGVKGGVFHLFRDLQSAEEELNKFEKSDGCVIAECFVPKESKVVIVGIKSSGEENLICSKTIKIRKIIDRTCA